MNITVARNCNIITNHPMVHSIFQIATFVAIVVSQFVVSFFFNYWIDTTVLVLHRFLFHLRLVLIIPGCVYGYPNHTHQLLFQEIQKINCMKHYYNILLWPIKVFFGFINSQYKHNNLFVIRLILCEYFFIFVLQSLYSEVYTNVGTILHSFNFLFVQLFRIWFIPYFGKTFNL